MVLFKDTIGMDIIVRIKKLTTRVVQQLMNALTLNYFYAQVLFVSISLNNRIINQIDLNLFHFIECFMNK